jgi:exodeoxyribonuclease V beta subunit
LVHEVLQSVPLESVQGRTAEAWLEDPATAELLQRFSGETRKAVGQWVHHALAGPLPLPGGGAAVLSRAERCLRELDFLTPYPGREDLLTGSLDVLFQWEGLAYVLDWKTNRLPSYAPEALARKVADDFLIQVQAYTLAACRFLAIAGAGDYEARFGGVIYVFLRGLPEEGVWTLRPSWEEVQGYERALAALSVETLIPVHAGGARHG